LPVDTAADYLNRLYQLLTYPLFELGDKPLTLSSLLKLSFLFVLVIVLERILRRSILQRILARTRLEEGMRFAIARMTGYVFIAIGFYVALKLVGIDLTSLAVLAGAIGVGIGFGLQNVVSNFISGVIILAERPIEVGHRIEVAGVAGRVMEIKLRSTVVLTNDNISVIVPNSNLISEPVVNWSYGDPKVRLNLPIGIAYGSDVEVFRRSMIEVAVAHPQVLATPAPEVFFIGFGDSSLNFELGVWTAEVVRGPKKLRSDLYYAIERTLRENKIEIPFPQRDVHVRSGILSIQRSTPAKPFEGAGSHGDDQRSL
jgi:small-conductance mechanosensitive channel